MVANCKQRATPDPRRPLLCILLAFLATPALAQAEELRRFDLALNKGALPKEQRTIKVNQNDSVELRWTTDQPIRLHLHGYDIEIELKPGEPTVTTLKARMAGRFSVDKVQEQKPGTHAAHQHGGKVMYFEVHP